MSQHSILIRTHVEACYLETDNVVSNPLGEYSGLPWLFKNGDVAMDMHFENAYLGEEILAPPFQNANSLLGKGVHLHWVVPAFLGKQYGGKLNAAPNRWLVEKSNGEKWLVVSDYVHEIERPPAVAGQAMEIYPNDDYSVYPISRSSLEEGKPPFCYLGKNFPKSQIPLETELESQSFQKMFGHPLTVLGFGNVQFSASYPNCKSVFGFHDPEGKLGDSYNITGWHALETDDLILNTCQAETAPEGINLAVFLKENFDVSSSEKVANSLEVADLHKTLYVASIKMDSAPEPVLTDNLKITVGNTATEAFSALLAHLMSSSQATTKVQNEDQLEYFLMNAQMDGHLTDHAPKFLEARHRKGFSLHKGGSLYAMKEHFVGKTNEYQGEPLKDDLYNALNRLNENKQALTEAESELESLKAQLYADWYKYMRAAYPPLGSKDLFPDRDVLQYLLETASLRELEAKEKEHAKFRIADRYFQSILAKVYHEFLSNTIKDVEDFILRVESSTTLATGEQAKAKDDWLLLANGVQTKLAQELSTVNEFLQDPVVQAVLQLGASDDPEQALEDHVSRNAYPDPAFPENPLLKETPDKPFWEPTEPVIAVDGFKFGSRSPEIFGKTGQATWLSTLNGVEAIPAVVGTPFESQRYSELHWCPFFMEWAVDLEDAPVDVTGLDSDAWKEAFFSHFYLDDDSPGVFRKKNADDASRRNDAYFQGGTILNPFMQTAFVEGMETYIAFCDKRSEISIEEDKASWQTKKILAKNAQTTILGKDILCQRLSGFNSACLMLRQASQLEIKEPLGFESSVAFSNTVAAKCEDGNQLSPSPLYEFLPIRNGRLEIKTLRFLDNFGMCHDINDFSQVITADTLTSEELRNTSSKIESLLAEIFLPPRLIQPARLNLHFIEGSNERMTDNPNTSPICGWFVPNFFNENIMVFAADGNALGTLNKEDGWRKLPWDRSSGESRQEIIQRKVSNYYFRRVILKILAQEDSSSDSRFIDALLSALQDGLANIAPADFALQSAKVLLMGRPIAVVRVRAGLQIKGFPALDQSWRSTMLDAQNALEYATEGDAFLRRGDRFSGQWNLIDLPLRLGEHLQLNDGLLGYWLEENEELSEQFYAPQTDCDASGIIASYKEVFTEERMTDNTGNPFIHRINPDGEELTFTALMDPRGVLHATTGILPTEVISIPSTLYQKALEQMLMWFETGPVLHYDKPLEAGADGETFEERRFFDLPNIPDYKWQWFEKPLPFEELIDGELMEIAKPDFGDIHEKLPEIKSGYLVLKR